MFVWWKKINKNCGICVLHVFALSMVNKYDDDDDDDDDNDNDNDDEALK